MVNIKDFNEREFHPFLNYFLNKELGIAAKTIQQEKTRSSVKGENEWVHADMVGFTLPVLNYKEGVVRISEHYNLPKVIMYSYELKKEITMGTLRQVFFQAVSNSSWANEGYLVTVDLNEDDEKLMKTIARLSNSFGIGVIKLNIEDINESKIVFEAKRKETIDWDFANHLYEINEDFKNYFRAIEDSLKIRRIVYDDLDDLLAKKELEAILNKNNHTQPTPTQVTVQTNIIVTQDGDGDGNTKSQVIKKSDLKNSYYLDWSNRDVTGKKIISFEIDGQVNEVKNWRYLLIDSVEYFYQKDNALMEGIFGKLKGNKRPYFTKDSTELREPYLLDGSGYYVEANLSSEAILRIFETILKEYNYSTDDVKIKISN